MKRRSLIARWPPRHPRPGQLGAGRPIRLVVPCPGGVPNHGRLVTAAIAPVSAIPWWWRTDPAPATYRLRGRRPRTPDGTRW